jgi:hypothetical protein
MIINYVGDFKLLIPMGYTYQKLYGGNRICYHRDGLWIWRAGKELGIEDMYSNSHLVLQYLIDNDFKVDRSRREHILIVDMAEGVLELYDRDKHEMGFGFTVESCEAYWDTHRKFYIKEKLVAPLKDLYEKGLIKIQ